MLLVLVPSVAVCLLLCFETVCLESARLSLQKYWNYRCDYYIQLLGTGFISEHNILYVCIYS